MIIVPLIVAEGVPLHVAVLEKAGFKESEPIRGRLTEAVYAFDREVIPAGTVVEGRITGFRKAGKWKRFSAMLSGNFTPQNEPEIQFDSLVLSDNTRIPMATVVFAGNESVVRSDRPFEDSSNTLLSTGKGPSKNRLKDFLWSFSPYRPRSLAVGTPLKAVLVSPLNFGSAVFEKSDLEKIGSQPSPGTVVSARLITSMDSRVDRTGASVEAALTRPIFDADRRLLFPTGSRLRGEVLNVNASGNWHRNGELSFSFTTIEAVWPTTFATVARDIEGRVMNMRIASKLDDIRIDDTGAMQITESKMRFIAPAYSLVSAGRSIGDTAEPFGQALTDAFRSKATKSITGKQSTLGLPGSIAGAMIPPVGIGLGVFSAARGVFSNFIGRGQDVRLPFNTSLEIRLQ